MKFFLKLRWALLLLCLLALALRLWGLDFGLPNLSRPDEQNISEFALLRILGSCAQGQCDFNPHFFEYPSLFIYAVAVLYAIVFALGSVSGEWSSFAAFAQLYANDQTLFHLIARGLGAVCGALTVLPVYALARQLHPARWVAYVAAALLAFCFLHVRDSHFGVTDVPSTLFSTCVLWAAVAIAVRAAAANSKPSDTTALTLDKPMFWGSVCVGLAGGLKYPAGLSALALWIAMAARYWPHKSRIITMLLLSLGVAAGVFFITTPYAMLDIHGFLKDVQFQMTHLKDGHLLYLGQGWVYHAKFSLWHGLGPFWLVFALGIMVGYGWILLMRPSALKTPVAHAALLGFTAAFYVYMGNTPTVFSRYVIPLLPVFSVYTALGLALVYQALTKPKTSGQGARLQLWQARLVVALLGVLIAGQSVKSSLLSSALLAQPDTRVLARRYLLSRVMPGESVGIGVGFTHLSLPDQYRKYFLSPPRNNELPRTMKGAGYMPSELPPLVSPQPNVHNEMNISSYRDKAFLKAHGIRYFSVGVSSLSLFTTPDFELNALDALYTRVATFSPMRAGYIMPPEATFNAIDAFHLPMTDLDGYERPGPEIRIYRVD
ncbi:MAG: phospholipid carrier-dependent glycosyltransferase [Vampirovibrionales bacterium]|nr:phospholipid carrier-dependent glycosyltransferase [Vampirovibrionales bacterium]